MEKDILRALSGEYDQVVRRDIAEKPQTDLVALTKAFSDPSLQAALAAVREEGGRSSDDSLVDVAKAWQEVATSENPVTKALVISAAGTEVQSASNARPSVEAEQNFFLGAGALIPRYDPWALTRVWENSSALRSCIDAYCANVDAYGFRLEPVIDLDKDDAPKLVRTALLQERIYEGSADPVDEDHVQSAIETMRLAMERERFDLERFFAYCNPITSFVEMRMQTRLELEAIGNAYWEVIRNGVGKIQQFERVDSVTMRLRPIHIEHVLVDTPQKISPITYKDVPVPRRFRTFVQLVNGLIAVYFKEFGDTRTLSAKTGNFYASREELKEKEGDLAVEATEILWWSIFTPIGPYGIPRWVGATMNVLGLRASEEINFSYFDKKCIPPMAILVSGGSLKEGAVDKIRNHLNENIAGRENFHAVLVIEAESAPGQSLSSNARVKVELRPLTEAQLKDAMFQEYEKNGTSKIGAQFRLPELLRGVSQEVNRAQAMAVLQFAEQQVFEPIRQSFDHVMNRRILADMGIRYWTFKTNSAPASDPVQLTTLTTQLATGGALTVNETRALASEAMNKEFKKIQEGWADKPYTLALQKVVGLDGNAAPAAPPGGPPGAGDDVSAPGAGDAADAGAPPEGAPDGAAKPPKALKAPPDGIVPGGEGASSSSGQGDDSDDLASQIASATSDVTGGDATAKSAKVVTLRVPMSVLLDWVIPDPT